MTITEHPIRPHTAPTNPRPRSATSGRLLASLLTGLMLIAIEAGGAEIRVMMSGGFTAAYLRLVPEFEAATGHRVVTVYGPSLGTAPPSIPGRLQQGEAADMAVMVGYALHDLVQQGHITTNSCVDLARSCIGLAVRTGSPRPDISTVPTFVHTLLAARSIGYSDSASGVFLSEELFPKLGLAKQLEGKCRRISGAVGAAVARGEVELGFQQISELLPISGIELVGALPAEIQKVTVFSAGIAARAKEPAAARQLIEFLSAPSSAGAITASGMEPVNAAPAGSAAAPEGLRPSGAATPAR